MRSLNQKDHLKHFLKKTRPRAAALRKLMSVFEKKPSTFTRKPKFWNFSFWEFLSKSNSWNASWNKFEKCISFFKKSSFFQRTLLFSRKEKKLETPEKFWAFLPLECWKIILQKLCQIKRFWKLWNCFPKTPMYFCSKPQNSSFLRTLK